MRIDKQFRPALVLSLVAACAALADEPKADLEVTRVALFSSGVGYFEREATVTGNASAELNFRTQQINDIIKSLVIQDFGGGTVGVVSYASHDPLEKTLRSFGVDLTGKPTLAQLLEQLRGEPVELGGGRTVSGTILGVEKLKRISGEQTVEIDVLNLLTDAGLQQVPFSDIGGVKLLNADVNEELKKALAALARSHDAEKKSVVLRFDGQGQRRVRAAYLLEAPIWKTTYRMVLAPEKKPFLQGWATVENATENDWKDVQLSLVSGRPISFVMDLYTPIYIPRPKVELELYASLRPPTYVGGFEQYEDQAGIPAPAPADAAGKAIARTRRGGRDSGATGELSLVEAGGLNAGLELQDSGVQSVATARDAGELFEYVIDTPVSIPRQHSAMLPIVNQEIEAEKVSIFNEQTHPKHPLNGLYLTNSSKLNLMQGPITVFDDNVYAGDAKLPDLKPGEKRFVSYALDLATEVMIEGEARPDEIVSLKIARGVLVTTRRYETARKYVVRNKDDKARTVVLEHPYTDNWTLIEPKEPFEKASGLLRFKIEVPAGKTVERPVKLEYTGDQTVALAELGLDQIRILLRAKVISPKVKEALERVIAMRKELERMARERGEAEQQLNTARNEQGRVRENLKTLDKSTDAYRRQLAKFDEFETRIEKLDASVAELKQREESKRQELENYLLSLDVG